MNKFIKIIAAIAICESAGILGAVFTMPSIPAWYRGLAKPAFTPPSWVFGPAWTILFALMGIAAYLVWEKGLAHKGAKAARAMFFVQLALNILWSFIFFGKQNPGGAFVEIIFLWLAILATILAFAKISKAAAWLLVPYIVWVSFAGYLNYSIWRLEVAPQATACTTEAKICPDGTSVGRTGPDCEFSPCPSVVLCQGEACSAPAAIPGWKTSINADNGFSFQYPADFSTKYISIVDWPPAATIVNEPFSCAEAGSEIAAAGITRKQTINGRDYCVTKESEGAAGSVYTQYAYAISGDSYDIQSKTIILTFSLRFVQCANYDDPQKTECENERAAFAPDAVIDRIERTLNVKK